MRHDLTNSRGTQRSRILALLIAARGAEVSLPEILGLNIAQFGSRILELRAMGFRITNRQECRDGQRLSFYRLESGATVPPPAPIAPKTVATQAEMFCNSVHRDDG